MKGLLQLAAADVILNLKANSRDGVLSEFAARLAERSPSVSERDILQFLLERESLGSTGIGDGIAIPHCKSPAFSAPVIMFGRSFSGIDFQAVDEKPVYIIFLFVTPEGDSAIHLKLLSRISRLLKGSSVRKKLLDATSEEEIVDIVMEQGIAR